MKILLIGAGNMGGAMLSGWGDMNVTVVEAHEPRAKELEELYPSIKILSEIPSVDGYVVVLAIKPQSLDILQVKGEAETVISILAGTPLSKIKEKIFAKSYIRAMPNIAALKRKAITSITGDVLFKEQALEIMSSIGKVIWLDSEEHLDIATAIGGSAPAWMAMVAEALSDGAVNMGLPRNKSYEIIATLMDGMGALLKDEHPAIIKDKVTSPAGTTITGVEALEHGGMRGSFIDAVRACYERTKELS